MTRLLFTTIPHFKEVVTMSFHCDSCGWSNNELQPAATIQEKGISFKLECTKVEVLVASLLSVLCLIVVGRISIAKLSKLSGLKYPFLKLSLK